MRAPCRGLSPGAPRPRPPTPSAPRPPADVETDVWRNGTVAELAARTRAFLVTRGGEGADEYLGRVAQRHPVFAVDRVVDTNGERPPAHPLAGRLQPGAAPADKCM